MQMTKIDLRDGGRVLRTIEVPFTHNEAELLRSIEEEDREALVKDMAAGSGWIRDLYLDWPVPWGCLLLDRNKAIKKMRQAEKTIASLLQRLEATGWQSVLTSERKKVEKALRAILEKLPHIPENQTKKGETREHPGS